MPPADKTCTMLYTKALQNTPPVLARNLRENAPSARWMRGGPWKDELMSRKMTSAGGWKPEGSRLAYGSVEERDSPQKVGRKIMKSLQSRLAVGVLAIGVASMAMLAMGGARTEDPLGIAVSPQTLLIGTQQSGTVVVHTDIPLSAVDTSTLKLNGLPVVGAYADSLGHLVAVFVEADVKAVVAPPCSVLTLTGAYRTGVLFSGSDTVSVAGFAGN